MEGMEEERANTEEGGKAGGGEKERTDRERRERQDKVYRHC